MQYFHVKIASDIFWLIVTKLLYFTYISKNTLEEHINILCNYRCDSHFFKDLNRRVSVSDRKFFDNFHDYGQFFSQ